MKNCIMIDISLTKTEQNNWGVLSSVSQSHAEMNKMYEG